MVKTCPRYAIGSGELNEDSDKLVSFDCLMMHDIDDLSDELRALLDTVMELAMDLRWTWSHAGDALWNSIDPVVWQQTKNPSAVLQNLDAQRMQELNNNAQFKERLQKVTAERQEYLAQSGWYGEKHSQSGLKGIAYFSMEFGLGEALPLYAGGLGILAGDYLKAASDLGVPVIGIGLLYQEGYFRQAIDASGWQQDIYPYNEPTSMPVRPVRSRAGAWLRVYSDFPGRRVSFRVWQAQVGRVTLYLLDSNDLLNSPRDQGITSKLYGGGQEMRLVQEIVLGICGWRIIEALGLEIDICHLNEGHAAFVTLERARCFMDRNNVTFQEALWATRPGNIFTTHTPVAAGFDIFSQELIWKYGQDYTDQLSLSLEEIGRLGRNHYDDPNEPFNMAYLAMRTCGTANGVSRLHGEVSRRIFQDLYPRWPELEVPITHITNGVHVPSWDSPWADELWTQAAGKKRWLGDMEPLVDAIENLSDEALWIFCGQERAGLVDYTRKRLALYLGQRGEPPENVAVAQTVLDPNVLTLGFARRFASYKRPNLLLHDQARLIRLLTNIERPVQIIVAGKAHPNDEAGKFFIQQWVQLTHRPEVRAHVVFLEDYDIALAQELVQGVDVWINTPRRPWEACGTSGMKVLVNGGLNLSELDGWWAEAYADDVGWALGDGSEHEDLDWDVTEAEQLYRLLEEEIIPLFYERDTSGIPRAWVARMRASMSRLTPQFSTGRMMREYVERLYLPCATKVNHRTAHGGKLGKELYSWEQKLRCNWQEIHWGNLNIKEQTDGWSFEVQIYLGDIPAEFVQIQLYAAPLDADENFIIVMQQGDPIPGSTNGYSYQKSITTTRPAENYTPRVVPYHPQASVPNELGLIHWQR